MPTDYNYGVSDDEESVIKSHGRNRAHRDKPRSFGDDSGSGAQEAGDSDPDADSHSHDISHDTPAGVRHCPRCRETKPREAFGTRTKRGKRVPQPYCKPCMVDFAREWRATPTGAAKWRHSHRAAKLRHPERGHARNQLRAALLSGRVQQGECYAAGPDCAGAIEAHHDDYARPLDVVWTCRRHHRPLDRARQAREAA